MAAVTSAAPLLLLHSSLSSGLQWRRLSARLRPQRPVLAPDLIGYGEAVALPPPERPHRLEAETSRLRELLRGALGEQPFHLVGHSFGGATALRLARECPQRVLSLSLFEPVAFHLLPLSSPHRHAMQSLAGAMAAALERGEQAQAAERFVDYWGQTGSFAALPPASRTRLAAAVPKVLADFEALLGEPATGEDYRDALAEHPVLLLEGEYSRPAAREVVAELRRALPQAEHAVLACGHMGPVVAPETVNPVIVEFLARRDRAQPATAAPQE